MSQTNLETSRLVIRTFSMDDLAVIHRILDQAFGDGSKADDLAALRERQSWLQWTILNQDGCRSYTSRPMATVRSRSKQAVR